MEYFHWGYIGGSQYSFTASRGGRVKNTIVLFHVQFVEKVGL